MATSTFSAKITDLVGGTIDDNACDDWMTEGAKEIINQLPVNLKEKCIIYTEVTGASGTDLDSKGEVSYVTRLSANSNGYYVPCRQIPSRYGGLASDSSDLNYYGTASDPVYWVSGSGSASLLHIYPDPDSTQRGRIYHIAYPTIDNGTDNSIDNFPDEAEHLVVLYAATRQLLQYMSSTALSTFSLSASAPSAPTIATVSYADASNADASATAVGSVTVGTVAKAAMDGNAPTYTPPAITNAEDGSIGDDTDKDITEMSTASWTALDYDFDNENMDFLKWFQVAGDMIQNQEDTELAQAQMQKITTFINTYSIAMQNKLNIFNKENVRYQANVQAEITKANADLQKVINQANIDAQDARQEAQQATNIDQFNKAQDQALNLANAAKQMEDIIANNNSLIQKFNSEISKYSASVNGEVQAYTQQVAEKTNEYQWYGDQYAKLSAEYQRGLAALKGGD